MIYLLQILVVCVGINGKETFGYCDHERSKLAVVSDTSCKIEDYLMTTITIPAADLLKFKKIKDCRETKKISSFDDYFKGKKQ